MDVWSIARTIHTCMQLEPYNLAIAGLAQARPNYVCALGAST